MIEFDQTPFFFLMRKLSRVTGRTMYDLSQEVMALMVKDVVKRTPPIGEGAKAKKIGERRIYKDVSSIIRVVPDDQIDQFSSQWVAHNDGQPIGHMFKRKDGSVYGVDFNLLGLDMSVLQAAHQAARSKKTGRTSKAGTYTRNIGRWVFVNRVHAPAALRRAYMKLVQGHVGKTKSGWLAALHHFCVMGHVPFPVDIDFVQRHGAASGSYIAAMNLKGTGTLTAINSIPWIGRFEGLIRYAVRNRVKDFTKGFFETRILGKWKAAGIV